MLIKCLSIQQPFADLIMSGRKPVENRSWTWMKERDWKSEGSVLLGIHASTRMAQLTDEELDDYVVGWRTGADTYVGCVLGVVDLVQICRPDRLSAKLRKNSFVHHDADNWCWVVENPRELTAPFPAKGNARLFNIEVPSKFLPKGMK